MLTVKELKQAIQELPDEDIILLRDVDSPETPIEFKYLNCQASDIELNNRIVDITYIYFSKPKHVKTDMEIVEEYFRLRDYVVNNKIVPLDSL